MCLDFSRWLLRYLPNKHSKRVVYRYALMQYFSVCAYRVEYVRHFSKRIYFSVALELYIDHMNFCLFYRRIMFHHKTKCNIAHHNFHCPYVKESARDRIQSNYVTFQAHAQQKTTVSFHLQQVTIPRLGLDWHFSNVKTF